MEFQGFPQINWAYWITWQTVLVGSTVAGVVYVTLRRIVRWRRRLARFSREEDLPWEELLELLRGRERELAASGSPTDKELPPDQLLAMLLSRLPDKSAWRSLRLAPEDRQFLESGGAEKRSGRRRWGNPVDVNLTSPLHSKLHGIVINRSTGGLGIFVDQNIDSGAVLEVRPAEAPFYVPAVEIEVKFCRKVRKQFFIGCEFCKEVPWNVRVWFG
jgi:hypothetical protein